MSRLQQFALFALLLTLGFLHPTHLHAEMFDLGNDDYNRVYGIGDLGDAVVMNLNCDAQGDTCYETYLFNSQSIFGPLVTTTPSPLPLYPVETPASLKCVAGPGFSISVAACNNGYVVFSGTYYNPSLASTLCSNSTSITPIEADFCRNGGELIGLFDGLDPFTDYLDVTGYLGEVFPVAISLNAEGDYLFDDGNGDEVYLSVNTLSVNTPEPPSIALASSSSILLAVMLWTRRRIRSLS